MTKIKTIVLAEVDGVAVAQTEPEFIFGFDETLKPEELDELLRATSFELVGILQNGLRNQSPRRGIKVWPEQG